MVLAIRADVLSALCRYRKFCRSLKLFACERFWQMKLCGSVFKKKDLSRAGREGEVSGEGGFELGCPAALRETSSRPRATLFFSAGFFSLEKKRVQTSKMWFVLGDRGKILRIRLKTERRILSCLICCAATRANRQNRKPYFPSRARSLCASSCPRGGTL